MHETTLPFCFLAENETTECAHPIDGKEGGTSVELWFLIGLGAIGLSSKSRAMRDEKLPHRGLEWPNFRS